MANALTGRRAYLLSLGLLLSGGALLVLIGRRPALPAKTGYFRSIPREIHGWRGRDLPVSERDLKILGSSRLLFRQYRKGERAVNLYLLESSSNRVSFHPPEYCFIGARAVMLKKGLTRIRGAEEIGPAWRYLFRGSGGESLVYYWYFCAGKFTSSYYYQQLQVILNYVRKRPRPAFLLRLSVEGKFREEEGDAIIADFVREVLPEIKRYLEK